VSSFQAFMIGLPIVALIIVVGAWFTTRNDRW
jgi:hypothetical protein